jgi:hypothetical protein
MTPLYTILKVPSVYTRVLAPIPRKKCAEHNYINVRETGELLHKNAVLVPAVNISQDEDCKEKPLSAPPCPRKKSSRRIRMQEKILPFELHGRIIMMSMIIAVGLLH